MTIKQNPVNDLRGGGSNTPLTDTYISIVKKDKEVLIDWLSASLDFINVDFDGYKTYSIDLHSQELKQLVSYFGVTDPFSELVRTRGHNGFAECYMIGEFIRLHYGLGQLNSNGKSPLHLVLSGSACREFENNMNGNWSEFIEYLLINGASIKRFDNAIDDFQADEIDIYDIEEFVKKRHYVSPLQSLDVRYSTKTVAHITKSTGFSLTFGSSGSNQLQIYDKILERIAKKEYQQITTDLWYRYELRFVNEKAHSFASLYVQAVKENNSIEYMTLVRQALFTMLDIKLLDSKDSNVSRWETLPKWTEFLESVSKIKISVPKREKITMLKRKLYFKRSYSKFFTSLNLDMSPSEFTKYIYDDILINGLEKMNETDLAIINNSRDSKGLPRLTMSDIYEKRRELIDYKTYTDEENHD